MIKKKWSLAKFVKLYIEVKFYKIAIFMLMLFLGYEHITVESIKYICFSVLYSGMKGKSFPEVFLIFFLLIPFLNKLINNLKKEAFEFLLLILLMIYSVIYTFLPGVQYTIHYAGWFMTVYMIGAYISLYPKEWMSNKKLILRYCILSLAFVMLSIYLIDVLRLHKLFGVKNYYYWVIDSNKLSAILSSICFFLFFKNLRIRYNPTINLFAQSVFPILLIHANSNAMRKFLWGDLLQNVKVFKNDYFLLHMIASTIGVYIVCFFIDRVRISAFNVIERKYIKNSNLYCKYKDLVKRYDDIIN